MTKKVLSVFIAVILLLGCIPPVTAAGGITITTQPHDTYATAGASFTMKVVAEGTGLAYQWQYRKPGSSSWVSSTAASAKTAVFLCTAADSYNGRSYRCKITDSNGSVAYSNAVKLTITDKFAIREQPEDVTCEVGSIFRMRVFCTGKNLSYQWYYSKDGVSWVKSTAASAKTATLSCTAVSSYDGRYYRCVVSDGTTKKTSASAKLTVASGLKITGQPQDVTVKSGSTFCMTVAASGTTLTYQWQYSKNGGEAWVSSTLSSAKKATFSCAAADSYNGRLYRCIVTDSAGNKVTSNAAKLTVTADFAITSHPAAATVNAGETFTMTVKATGTGLAYQWQYSKNGGETWVSSTIASAKKATFSCSASESYDGRLFRCIVTDGTGKKLTSKSAKLTVVSAPPTGYVKTISMTLHTAPKSDSPTLTIPYMTAFRFVDVIHPGADNRWYCVSYDGGIYYFWSPADRELFTTTPSTYTYKTTTDLQKQIVDAALPWKDAKTRYDRGDNSGIPDEDGYYTFDCSGFTCFILDNVMQQYIPTYRSHTDTTKLYTMESVYNAGYNGEYKIQDVPLSQIQAGDLIFFKTSEAGSTTAPVNHVGIYLGNNEFIHSTHYNWGGNGVYVSPLIDDYLDSVVAIRRFLPDAITPANQTMYVSGSGIYIRDVMDVSAPPIGSLAYNTPVKLLYTDNANWAYIEYETGKYAFISLKYLKPTQN